MAVTPELSRIAKVLVDSGRGDFAQAEARLRTHPLEVRVAPGMARRPAAQAAALTAVATGTRCMPGGVALTGETDVPLSVPLAIGARTLAEAAALLGADGRRREDAKVLLVGGHAEATDRWATRVWWRGWTAGTAPRDDIACEGLGEVAIVGAAAGALGVGAAFRSLCGDLTAGREREAVSVWDPGGPIDDPGPGTFHLPDALWLLGLGNLGQAFVWTLSLLPYADPGALRLVLQDRDVVKPENRGTSILVHDRNYGAPKARVVEGWALARGFDVRRVDRWLDGWTRVAPGDPPMALAGLDSVKSRRLLDAVGFERIVDCGLGTNSNDYNRYRVTVLDPSYGAAAHFAGQDDRSTKDRNLALPAYGSMAVENPGAACGAAELAGAAVAVPFVSAFAAALAIAQAIRVSSGLPHARNVVGRLDGLTMPRAVGSAAAASRVIGCVAADHGRASQAMPGNPAVFRSNDPEVR